MLLKRWDAAVNDCQAAAQRAGREQEVCYFALPLAISSDASAKSMGHNSMSLQNLL
jgi:hypothetical protein